MERRHAYGGGIAVAGAVLTLVQLLQGLQQSGGFEGTTRAVVFTFETLPFVLVSLSLVYVGYHLASGRVHEADLTRITAWGVGSTLLFASVGALIVFSQQVKPTVDILDQAGFVAVNMITVGAVVGVLVGVYDARSRERQRDLQRERDRVERFAQKAADVNNYGRELNTSDSIDEVSALCIQAIQQFLGLTEIAVAAVEDGEVELVDNTVVNVSEDAIAEVILDSLDQRPATVVTHDSLPADLEARAAAAVSMLITSHEESSVVLLALTDEANEFGDAEVQLLEMLVTHAATALDRIYEGAATE
jgi:hypothetical protein